jgi:MinD superfamily P-loop ATPase
VKAIDFPERSCGEWFVSETRFGPMVYARLGIAAENSGKLVSTVRREARRIANERKSDWILVDGPPGIGCPVIASVTGASLVLVVTEPTLSGRHDMGRVLSLARHFEIPALVSVNKWDINPTLSGEIERRAASAGAAVAPRVRYDSSVTGAQIAAVTVVERGGAAANDIRSLWTFIEEKV